ncbi:hypothetical protein FWC63_02380, partial [Candidatus Saccharibacteria bacterium]|nr:hypothetical protein [Candidatus Saccharibacteria bacterium]
TSEPVAVRGVVEEVRQDFGQFWRLVNERPEVETPKRQLLVDVNRRVVKCFLSSLLAESLQFSRSGRVFARGTRGRVQLGVRDFGPALPRNFTYEAGRTLPLRPRSRAAFLMIHELSQAMGAELLTTSHIDGASFFIELAESRQVSLWC